MWSDPIKCSSAVDPLITVKSNDEFLSANRPERSNTYPHHNGSDFNPVFHKQTSASSSSSYHYSLGKPKLYTNALIGSSQNCQMLETLTGNQAAKRFKRLHQLCAQTAKQAINELRLMHYYFSTSYYLLRFVKFLLIFL